MNALHPLITSSVLFVSSLALGSCDNNKEKAPSDPSAAREPVQPSSPATEPSPEVDSAAVQRLRAECPMLVRGVKVEVSETQGGVALAFTTEEGRLADLRARVRHLAQMYEMHRGRGSMSWHRMGRGPHMGRGRHMGRGPHHMGGGPMPAAEATVTELEQGDWLTAEIAHVGGVRVRSPRK